MFFSQNKVLGCVLLLSTFFNPVAGISGLFCVLLSIAITTALNYPRDTINAGIYSFNSLLLGLAFGTFYEVNAYYVIWLIVACLLVVMVTVILAERLGRLGLPVLSLPFIFCFWLILLGANNVFDNRLLQKSSFIVQEIYNTSLDSTFNLSSYAGLFFRSLSAIIFQNSVIVGLLVAVGLLIHSRIAFCLLIIGFIAACCFNSATGVYPNGISYYYLGANFMMTSVAVGSFFLIPSGRSYLVAILCIPIVFLLSNAFSGLLSLYNLPIFSLPFCAVNIILLYFLLLRKSPGKLQLVPLQHYSPERNLYQFLNQKERLSGLKYFPLQLPFMGNWTVSQGYEGSITHKSDWAEALDFVIKDDEAKTYKLPGISPEDFYCFNKPVLACGDGIVANVIDHVNDNAIGEENNRENWGNTVVIKHLEGLYSKVSHLKKGSVKVKTGDLVKRGDLIGLCGNSGRSPEPHLHFQVQATPYIDAKTIAYPFDHYSSNKGEDFNSFAIPSEGEVICAPNINGSIKKAFDLQPGYTATIEAASGKESIEVFADELGQTYIYSKRTEALAYFVNDGTLFYFTSFYGDKRSLLYYFYLAAYKVNFSDGAMVKDAYPLQISPNKFKLWLQDLVAPFYRFIDLNYQSEAGQLRGNIIISSAQYQGKKLVMNAGIQIRNNAIDKFEIHIHGKDIQAQWLKGSIY